MTDRPAGAPGGKTVLITGAGGGIGKALVRTFSEAGYRVVGTDREAPETSSGCDAFVTADLRRTVADPAYAADRFDELRTAFEPGQLGALINNAAVQVLKPIEDLTVDDWTLTLNTNLLAPFVWTQALLPDLRAAGGSVVNISSIHAHQSKPRFVAYATSKAALSAMTRNMAIELGAQVRINAIEPAAVRTDMLLEGFEGREERLADLERCHPVDRLAEPDEIARVALFLCSDSASFLQGSVVAATGGIHGVLTDPD
jgi:NAD(P)-dependent dehydrogenase (short-subunit alcohol dehydrogenase family)